MAGSAIPRSALSLLIILASVLVIQTEALADKRCRDMHHFHPVSGRYWYVANHSAVGPSTEVRYWRSYTQQSGMNNSIYEGKNFCQY